MTLKERIRELNRTEDAQALRKFLDGMYCGSIRTRAGHRVYFDYKDARQFFMDCDPTIDAGRFEELMQLADYA